jgi:DNA-binding transcriptional LysR family regulator
VPSCNRESHNSLALAGYSITFAIFDELQEGVKEIRFLADPSAGEVRIGCGEAFGAGLLPAILERLGRQYPRIVYHVILTTSPEEELQVLRERRVDLLLTRVREPFSEEDMDAEVLFHERLCVVAGAKSKWARRRRIELAELLDEQWILTPPNSAPFALAVASNVISAKMAEIRRMRFRPYRSA